MNNNNGGLYFGAGIDMVQWRKDISEMRKDILGLTNETQTQTKKMDSSFKNLSFGIATYFSGQMLGNFANQIIKVRGEFQKTEIAFGTMLKSQDKAKALMADMVALAAKTPFGLQDVADGAKRLLAFQIPAEQVVDTLTRIGNVAAGLGVPMGQLIHVYGQVKAQGKLMTNDLYQFMNAGIPMTAELAKVMGVAENKVKDLISSGKVGFPEVQKVIANLTDEGGMFFNLMEAQSASLSGQIANLQDAWDGMLNKMGQSTEGIIGDIISNTTYLVEHYQDVIEVLKGLILVVGTYRAALILQNVAQSYAALSAAGMTTADIAATGAKRILTTVTATLNATILANPYALAAAAIAGLTYAIYHMTTQMTTAEELTKKFDDRIKESNASVAEQKAKIDALITAIKSENTTNTEKETLLQKLNVATGNKIKNLTVEAIKTGTATSAIKLYVEQLYRQAEAMAYVDELKDLYRQKSENDSIIDRADKGNTSAFEAIGAIFDRDTYANGGIKNFGLNTHWSEAIKHRHEEENKAIEERIKSTKKKIEATAGDIPEAEEKASQKEAKAIESAAKKTTTARETSTEERKKTFEEEIAEMKRQFEVRDKLLVAGYSDETVNKMFPMVEDSSFIIFLNKTSNALKNLIESGNGTQETANNLAHVTEVLREFQGQATAIEGVNDEIERLKSTYSGAELIDKLDGFAKVDTGFTESEQAQRLAIIERAKEEERKALNNAYERLLEEQQSYEEKTTAITKKYADIRASEGYQNASAAEKAKIDKSEEKEIQTVSHEAFKETDLWAAAFGDLEYMSNKALKAIKKGLQDYLKTAKNLDPTEIKAIQGAIEDADKAMGSNPFKNVIQGFKRYKESTDEIEKSNTLKKLMGDLGDAQATFNAIGNGVMELGDAFGGMSDATKDAIGSIMEIGNAAFDFASSLAKGDLAGMIAAGVKGIAAIFSALSGDKKKERAIKKQEELIRRLESAYNDLAFAAERAVGAQKYDASRDMIANMEAQKIAIQAQMKLEESKKKKDKDKIQGYKDAINTLNQSIIEMQEGIVADVLQTDLPDMASQLGDALVDAFKRGEDSVEGIKGAFDSMLQSILSNQLNLVLQKQLEGVKKNLLKAAGYNEDGSGSFDGFTEDEIASIREQYKTAASEGQKFLDAYKEIFKDLNTSEAQGLKGDIKGVTEKTAGALESQINAMRVMQSQSLETIRGVLGELVNISRNTYELHQMRKDLAELNSKVSKPLAGLN